jgi:deoxyguanosine kinase
MRIELVGGMGIGKTTLCNVLSEIGYHCILEDLGENPFLAKMYKDEAGFRFPSQMWFILSKYAELQAELKSNEINVIDQAILNIKAYTNLLFKNNPDKKAVALMDGLFDYIEDKFEKPDLLIYLKASPDIQMKRIHARNRDYELDVDLDYLTNLKAEIETLIHHERSQGQNVIEIDTDNIFLSEHHIFAAQLADDIAKRLKFCINPRVEKIEEEGLKNYG